MSHPTPDWQTTENYTVGRSGATVNLIVIHYIVGTLDFADTTFADPESQVSAHYGIGEQKLHQYVSEINTAWNSGDSATNRRSIGIEHSANVNRAPDAWTYETSVELCARICEDYGLDPQTQIIGHSAVVATACPGTVSVQRIRDGVSALL